jgi:hypothetical protein
MKRLEETVRRLRAIFQDSPYDTEFINETLLLFLLANTDKDIVIDGSLECNDLDVQGNLFVFSNVDANDIHCNEYKVGKDSCVDHVIIEPKKAS